MGTELPAVEVFTDYSQWERKPSTKSGTTRGGWSTGRSRGRGRGRAKNSIRGSRQDALLVAARLSQASVVVDPGPGYLPLPHCHSHSKKTSLKIVCQPREISTCTTSPRRRKIEKVKPSFVTPEYSMDKVSEPHYYD